MPAALLTLFLEVQDELIKVDVHDDFAKRLGTGASAKHMTELHVHFTELELGEHRTYGKITQIITRVAVIVFQGFQFVGKFFVERVELCACGIAFLQSFLGILIFAFHLVFALLETFIQFTFSELLRLFVDRNHDVRCEVHDLLECLDREIQKQSQTGRGASQKPDMCNRDGQIDVPHPLAAHNAARHFYSALLADHSRVPHSLVFATEALEVFRGSENALAEETIRLCPLRAVVHGFGLRDFSAGPSEDIFRGSNRQGHCIETIGCCGLVCGGRHGNKEGKGNCGEMWLRRDATLLRLP